MLIIFPGLPKSKYVFCTEIEKLWCCLFAMKPNHLCTFALCTPCYMQKEKKKTESRSKKPRQSTHDGDQNKLLCDHDDLRGFSDKKYLCHEYIADLNATKSNNKPQCCDDCKKIITRG